MKSVWIALAGAAALGSPALAAAPAPTLPPGAVVAFTPTTVCESLPGGWKTYADADGRVIVGMAVGVPAASPTPPPDYWTKGVALKSEMLPRSPVTGAGQIVVTTPEVAVKADALVGSKAAFGSPAPTMRLFGYPTVSTKPAATEALAVGYGSPGGVGKDVPDPVPVSPPFVALRYCVKD